MPISVEVVGFVCSHREIVGGRGILHEEGREDQPRRIFKERLKFLAILSRDSLSAEPAIGHVRVCIAGMSVAVGVDIDEH